MAQKNFIFPLSLKKDVEFCSNVKLSKDATISLIEQLTIKKIHTQLNSLMLQIDDLYKKNIVYENEIEKLKKKIKKIKNEDIVAVEKVEKVEKNTEVIKKEDEIKK